MSSNPSARDAIMVYLDEHPNSRMGDIMAHVLSLGVSTECGIQSVMRNLVSWGTVKVDRTHYKAFLYSVKDEARTVRHVHASRFEVPAELAGPVVPPLVWSMRHLLGVAA